MNIHYGSMNYDDSINNVKLLFANVYALLDRVRKKSHTCRRLKTWIHGAAISGKLTAFVLQHFSEYEFKGYIDSDPRFKRFDWFDVYVNKTPQNMIITLDSLNPKDVDVIICALAPNNYKGIFSEYNRLGFGQKLIVPIYSISDNNAAEREHPFVFLSSTGRSGTWWTARMIYHLLASKGYRLLNFPNDPWTKIKQSVAPKYFAVGYVDFNDDLKCTIDSGKLRTIFLYRDPRDIMVSTTIFFEGAFRFDISLLDRHIRRIKSWMQAEEGTVCFISFEDLKQNTFDQLVKIRNFLKLDAEDKTLKEIIWLYQFRFLSKGREPGQEVSTNHYRKGIIGDWKTYFNEQEKKLVNKKYGSFLSEIGFLL